MKFLFPALLLTLWLSPSTHAQQPQPPQEMTFTFVSYELLKKDAVVVVQGLTEIVDATALMQEATKAHAKISKLSTVKAQSGVLAIVEESGFSSTVEASLEPDTRVMAVRFSLNEAKSGLMAALALADGQTAFLGTLEDLDKPGVRLVFVRASLAAASSGTTADVLQTRTFMVRKDFLTSRRPPGSPPMKPEAILEAEGIPFPKGASATFIATQGKLIVKNTEANLAFVPGCLQKILLSDRLKMVPVPPRPPPEGIGITMLLQAYVVDKRDPLAVQAQTPGADAKELLARLVPQAARGLVKVSALPGMTGCSGNISRAHHKNMLFAFTPVVNKDQGLVNITGTYDEIMGASVRRKLLQADIRFGDTAFVCTLDTEKQGGKESVALLFLKVCAQTAAKAP